jgi:hypothetical protein
VQGLNGFSLKSFSVSCCNVEGEMLNSETFRDDFQSNLEQVRMLQQCLYALGVMLGDQNALHQGHILLRKPARIHVKKQDY